MAKGAASLFIQNGEDNPLVTVAVGAPITIVKAARSRVAEVYGNDSADEGFGMRQMNAKGNFVLSPLERMYSASVEMGGFAVIHGDLKVAGARTPEEALARIADAELLAGRSVGLETVEVLAADDDAA